MAQRDTVTLRQRDLECHTGHLKIRKKTAKTSEDGDMQDGKSISIVDRVSRDTSSGNVPIERLGVS